MRAKEGTWREAEVGEAGVPRLPRSGKGIPQREVEPGGSAWANVATRSSSDSETRGRKPTFP